MKAFINIALILISTLALGQLRNNSIMIVSDNTLTLGNTGMANSNTLLFQGNSQLTLDGTGSIESTDVLTVPNLTMQGGEYTIAGNLTIENELSLRSGTLSPGGGISMIIGNTGMVTRQEGFVNGVLYHTGTGDKFYPIGTNGTYTPVTLSGVQGTSTTLLGIQAVQEDINIPVSALPTNLNAVSSNWYWALISDDTFNGARAVLPVLPEDAALLTANTEGVVVEISEDRSVVESLGRGIGSDDTQVAGQDLTNGPVVAIGVRNVVQLTIRNLITPNGDRENDYLYIENLELIEGTKKVYFLDRWGARIGKDIMNFVNDDAGLAAFFESFESGNYICILQLEDGRTIQQAVTILKE